MEFGGRGRVLEEHRECSEWRYFDSTNKFTGAFNDEYHLGPGNRRA